MQQISYLGTVCIGWDFCIVSFSLELIGVTGNLIPEWVVFHSRAGVLNPGCTIRNIWGAVKKRSMQIFPPRHSDSNTLFHARMRIRMQVSVMSLEVYLQILSNVNSKHFNTSRFHVLDLGCCVTLHLRDVNIFPIPLNRNRLF